jgi:hypothetical protein
MWSDVTKETNVCRSPVQRAAQSVRDADLIVRRDLRLDREQNCVILSEFGLAQS